MTMSDQIDDAPVESLWPEDMLNPRRLAAYCRAQWKEHLHLALCMGTGKALPEYAKSAKHWRRREMAYLAAADRGEAAV